MLTKKQKIYKRRRIALSVSLIILVAFIISILCYLVHINNKEVPASTIPVSQTVVQTKPAETTEAEIIKNIYPTMADNVAAFDIKLVNSEHGVLIDVESNSIIAERDCNAKIYPASLTKIMTVLVAAENINDMNSTFTMTHEILEPLINQDATRAGFEEGEQVKLIDMMYGAILPSGADATIGLADAISGTEANFVVLMNKKAQEMGLKNTHFVNSSGLYDENHYSTAVDMAVILEYAMKNELCRKILSTYQYTTAATAQHPQGILLESTMFSRMYGTEVKDVTILGGKMGYTVEAGNCLASFATKNGKEYIAVTTNGAGKYKPIFDSFAIYENYLK